VHTWPMSIQSLYSRSCLILHRIVRQGQHRHLNCRKVTATKLKPLTQFVQFRAVPLTDSHPDRRLYTENVYYVRVVQSVLLRVEATHTHCVNSLYYLIQFNACVGNRLL